MPGHGSTECSVKAVSPAARGRSEAESLDGAEASRRMDFVMVGFVTCADDADRVDRMALPARRGGAVRHGRARRAASYDGARRRSRARAATAAAARDPGCPPTL